MVVDTVRWLNRKPADYVTRRRWRTPKPKEPGPSDDRGMSASVAGLLKMYTAVHTVSSACPGPLKNTELSTPIWHQDSLTAECETCGAVFGRMPLGKPPTVTYVLGGLLAGVAFEDFTFSREMADCQSPAVSTRQLLPVIEAVDEVYDDFMAQHREAIKREDGRKLVRVDPDKNNFLKHAAALNDIMKRGISVQVSTWYCPTFHVA